MSSSSLPVVPVYAVTASSNVVTVTLPAHGYTDANIGNSYVILNPTTVGGIVLSGSYEVRSVVDANTFTFLCGVLPSGSGSASANGGDVTLLYGLATAPPSASSGYGLGGYGLGGYGIGATVTVPPGTYGPASDWTIDNWGEDLVACPVGGMIDGIAYSPIVQWSPGGAEIIASAIPQAPVVNDGIFVAMPQRQIVAWGSTVDGVQDPLLVRWCDVGDYTTWIGSVTNQAGQYRLSRGSEIVGASQAPQQSLLWTDVDLWSMQYIGQPYIYSFNEIGTGCGLIARKAHGALNGVVYWMGLSNFFMLAGGGVQSIECPIWDVIFQNLDMANLDHIRCAPNSQFNEITWFYPVTGGNGNSTAYVKYNTGLSVWDYGTLDRSAWADQSVVGPPIGASASSLLVYQHEIAPDADNQPLVSWFLSGMFALSDADQKMFVDEVWPDMKWGYYGGQGSASITVTFYGRDFPGETPVVYGPYTVTAATQYFVPRIRARLLQIGIEGQDLGSWWRIGGMRYRAAADGRY